MLNYGYRVEPGCMRCRARNSLYMLRPKNARACYLCWSAKQRSLLAREAYGGVSSSGSSGHLSGGSTPASRGLMVSWPSHRVSRKGKEREVESHEERGESSSCRGLYQVLTQAECMTWAVECAQGSQESLGLEPRPPTTESGSSLGNQHCREEQQDPWLEHPQWDDGPAQEPLFLPSSPSPAPSTGVQGPGGEEEDQQLGDYMCESFCCSNLRLTLS